MILLRDYERDNSLTQQSTERSFSKMTDFVAATKAGLDPEPHDFSDMETFRRTRGKLESVHTIDFFCIDAILLV